MKRTLRTALVLAALVCLLAVPAFAQEVNARELAYAYIDTSEAYFITGRPVTVEAVVPDTAGLEFEFTLYYTHDREVTEQFEGIDRVKQSPEYTYTFTPEKPGQYFLEVYIYDANYRSLKLQSEPFYCYEPASESDPSTLPGKVKAIVSEMSELSLTNDYDRAMWLHDWLTGNADYDEPMTIHTPEGVLLQGTGVCESYALAYQMLLHEAGIDSLYVTGYSRGQLHAWNLVQLDGEWTYVDPTWNDPIGGEEGYDYFGMNDALMARDHDWTYSICKPPAATTLDYNYLMRNGAAPFKDEAELDQLMREALTAKEPLIWYTYHGEDAYFDVSYTLQQWMKQNSSQLFVDSYQFGGSKYSGRLEVTYGAFDDFTTFKDDAEFNARMDELLKAKTPLVKMYYVGDDRYFDFGSYIRKWLSANSRAYFIRTYQYTYLPASGEITLEYGDYEGYQTFQDEAGLTALLEKAAQEKPAQLKLYYTGTDEYYNMRWPLEEWLSSSDVVSTYQGSFGSYEADVNVTWK